MANIIIMTVHTLVARTAQECTKPVLGRVILITHLDGWMDVYSSYYAPIRAAYLRGDIGGNQSPLFYPEGSDHTLIVKDSQCK